MSTPKKKRYQLRYSRRYHDSREYGKFVLKPHFLDIIASQCKKDIEEAKKRVSFKGGKYRFEPSDEYLRARAKYKLSQRFKTN